MRLRGASGECFPALVFAHWIPAFAGMTKGGAGMTRFVFFPLVIPAQAGIQRGERSGLAFALTRP